MKRLLLICSLLSVLVVGAQTTAEDSASLTLSHVPEQKPEPKPFIFKPTIGLGVGMLSYYGDLYQKHLVNPQVSRVGYELSINQTITPFLRFGFYTMFGKLGANERLITRNENFESQIRMGGAHFEYDFSNWLGPNRNVYPWITVGFESFEFLTKTDLYDKNGNLYYYWSDGSIRSLPENSPVAGQASFLVRDYTYETDVRERNLDGFGKYAERSWAVPVGIGFTFKLTDQWDAKIGTTFHFTFTDYIDGISETSTGNRKGNSKNDNFVFTAFTLRYNLNGPEKIDTTHEVFADTSLYAFNDEDYDGDGILDLSDSCGLTPKGVTVDLKGCPLDDDKDLTADYRDKEEGTSRDLFADENGIGLTDSIIKRRWDMYNDSTGELFATQEILTRQNLAGTGANSRTYMVSLGTYTGGIPNALMTKMLSVSDVSGTLLNDSSTIYTAGKFTDLREAEKRRKQLEQQGFVKPVIVYKNANGKYVEVTDVFVNNTGGSGSSGSTGNGGSSGNNGGTGIAGNSGNSGNGGNSGSSGSSGNSGNGGNTGNGGNSGSSGNSGNGSTGIAGNSGNGGNAGNGGNNGNSGSSGNGGNSGSAGNTAINPADTGIVFRVQLGAFKHPISNSAFADVPNLSVFKTEDGLYKYTSGSYSTFEQAANAKAQLLVKGYNGAFITAYKNGKRIPLEKAGATYLKTEPEDLNENKEKSADVKSFVEFRVQVGVFKSEPPADVQDKLNKISGLKKDVTTAGLNRYTVGSTNDYQSILAIRDQMRAQGFPDAFVIAFFKGQQVTVPEALELLK